MYRLGARAVQSEWSSHYLRRSTASDVGEETGSRALEQMNLCPNRQASWMQGREACFQRSQCEEVHCLLP